VIVGPTQAQMNDFCDLHGTPDTPVSRIVTVNVNFSDLHALKECFQLLKIVKK
jgi:hypothetical protein